MKKLLTFLIVFTSIHSHAQMYQKWVTPYLQSFNFFQVHYGCLDSSSNFYTMIDNAADFQMELKKIDSTGVEVWNKVIWPDSIIPDTGSFHQMIPMIAANNNILTMCTGSSTTLLKLLDPDGHEMHRWYYDAHSIFGAYPSPNGNYYLMGTDTFEYLHNIILDSTLNLVHHDSCLFDGGGFSNVPFITDSFGNTLGFYHDFRLSGQFTKIFRYRNDQLVDSFLSTTVGNFTIDRFGYRYIYGNNGTTKYDTSWNVMWTVPSCRASDLKFDSQNNFYIYDRFSTSPVTVEKYDSNGSQIWLNTLSQQGLISHLPEGMLIDSSDHVIITGKKFDVLSNGTNNNDKTFVAHFSSAGHLDAYYERYYPGATAAFIADPKIDKNNNIYYYTYTLDTIYYSCIYPHFQANVSGEVFYDGNSNCLHDINETSLNHMNVQTLSSNYYTQSMDSGKFYFQLPDGNYQLACGVPPNWVQTCATNTVTLTNGIASNTLSFGLMRTPGINDLEIDFIHASVRANRDLVIYISYRNFGSTILDGTITFDFDSIFSFVNSNIAPDSNLSNHLAWNFTNLLSGEERHFMIVLHSGMYPTATPFTNTAFIWSQQGDLHMNDNLFVKSDSLIGSVDPNEKHVVPAGIGANGNISPNDSVLCYQILFQNTGTDTAMYIMVVDTLDENLDPLSFRLGSVSMPCTYTLSGNGVVKFIFDPCALPDSTIDEMNSHGYISYFIETDPNLPHGTIIKNKADIYFDYNLPITTNSTVNTVDFTLGTNKSIAAEDLFIIYPNPASTIVNLKFAIDNNSRKSITIYSSDGRVINMLVTKENYVSLPVIDLPDGLYFIEISSTKGTQTKMLNIIKAK